MGYAKRNKSCLPKKGRPHAQKSMSKKKEEDRKKGAYPKKVCHMLARNVKKNEMIAHSWK
jgi:hypothetical protein